MLPSAADATTSAHSGQEDDVADQLHRSSQASLPAIASYPLETQSDGAERDNPTISARLLADALEHSVFELRKDDEARMSRFIAAFQEGLSAYREGEENRIYRLEKAIMGLRPSEVQLDPETNFWTTYKKVSDEYDHKMVSTFVGDLDNYLLFSGLFSAVTAAFIVQIIPRLQPNPSDLTNTLLLRILQQNSTFIDGANPLAPVTDSPTGAASAQTILFTSLSITLFVAFVAMSGKRWILHYTRASTRGSIVDRGKDRQLKFAGLRRWGLHIIMESLPVLLQVALLLFAVGIITYLWDLDLSAAGVALAIASIGCVFYACTDIAAAVWSDCPFRTSLSALLPGVLPWAKKKTAIVRVWARHALRRWSTALLLRVERVAEHGSLMSPIRRWCKTFGRAINPDHFVEDVYDKHYSMELSNPAFWRQGPLFTSPLPKDTAASAGFWLLENSVDSSAATAVAAAFPEFQWPSLHHSTTALIRLRDTYMECFRAPVLYESARLKALQSAAAYYVLYHSWLIWTTSKSRVDVVPEIPSHLPPDLFLYKHSERWGGDDLFEYLLRIKDHSEPVTSARFLSYIAPYWFCGDSDSAVRFRSSRLQTLHDLIALLESSQALGPATLTDCVLCVGAAMDFPLHPEDLIRVDKSGYFVLTFQTVVEHIHAIILARSRRHRYATKALGLLLTLAKLSPFPIVDATWMGGLLRGAAEGDMSDEQFTLFLRLSARRMGEDAILDTSVGDHALIRRLETGPRSVEGIVTSEPPTADHTIFSRIMKNIQACVWNENGWQDDAVYGGLVAIAGIRRLGPSPFDDDILQTLHDAMDNDKPFRVRKAAYDVMLVTRDQWLRSNGLRQTFKDLGFFKKMHNVVVEVARADYQQSFLMMMEILSEDENWHSYLREAMGIWLPLRHEGPEHIIHILTNVGKLFFPRWNGYNPSLDEYLQGVIEDEWAAVPGRHVQDLTVDRLTPLVEVTGRFRELLFDDVYQRAVLVTVERVIPALERRSDDSYGGPEDVRGVFCDLMDKLRSTSPPGH